MNDADNPKDSERPNNAADESPDRDFANGANEWDRRRREETAADVTQLLNEAAAGDQHAADQVVPLIYSELRKIASAKRRSGVAAPQETLGTTALVHEAYTRVLGREPEGWQQRSHFFYAAACAMRDLLVEDSRRRGRTKHGGGLDRIELDEAGISVSASPEQVLALDRCLQKLEDTDELGYKLVMFRFFVGMSTPEVAQALKTPLRTVERKWQFLRVWLARELAQ